MARGKQEQSGVKQSVLLLVLFVFAYQTVGGWVGREGGEGGREGGREGRGGREGGRGVFFAYVSHKIIHKFCFGEKCLKKSWFSSGPPLKTSTFHRVDPTKKNSNEKKN